MSAFAVSVVVCVIIIKNIWTTWRTHPVTVTFDDTATPIQRIPFPVVTICSYQKIKEGLTKIEENDGFEKLFPGE